MTKECSSCLEFKLTSEFNQRFKSKDGLQFICRSCQSIKNRLLFLDKDKSLIVRKRNLTLKSLKKRLSRAIKCKSNVLQKYIGITISDLLIKFHHLGFDYQFYGKTWGVKLIKPIEVFSNPEDAIIHTNLIPFKFK